MLITVFKITVRFHVSHTKLTMTQTVGHMDITLISSNAKKRRKKRLIQFQQV